MAAITYTAVDRGALYTGHSDGVQYSFDVPVGQFSVSPKRNQDTAVSLSGNRVTTLHRVDQFYNISTVEIEDAATLGYMREFLSSVVAGETFTFDLYGTVAAPDSPVTLKLTRDSAESANMTYITFNFQGVKV